MPAPTPPVPQLTAVVVSHDSGAFLHACVADLLAQDVAMQVVVVDNGSRDGAPDALPSDPRLALVRNPDNPGFATACNQGAAQARAASLLFVNPDCRLPPDAASRLLAHLAAAPELGFLGARLLNPDGSDLAAAQRRTPLPGRAIAQALGRCPVPQPRAGSGALLDVEATSGALMLMPRDVFESLGGFDGGYVLHCEDLDLCRRALLAGWRIAIATDVEIIHAKGTSSRRRPVWVEWQKHRGMWRYFHRFDAATSPWWLRALVRLGIAAHFPLAAARACWRVLAHSRPD